MSLPPTYKMTLPLLEQAAQKGCIQSRLLHSGRVRDEVRFAVLVRRPGEQFAGQQSDAQSDVRAGLLRCNHWLRFLERYLQRWATGCSRSSVRAYSGLRCHRGQPAARDHPIRGCVAAPLRCQVPSGAGAAQHPSCTPSLQPNRHAHGM